MNGRAMHRKAIARKTPRRAGAGEPQAINHKTTARIAVAHFGTPTFFRAVGDSARRQLNAGAQKQLISRRIGAETGQQVIGGFPFLAIGRIARQHNAGPHRQGVFNTMRLTLYFRRNLLIALSQFDQCRIGGLIAGQAGQNNQLVNAFGFSPGRQALTRRL